MTDKFDIDEWVSRGNDLLERSKEFLSSVPNKRVQSICGRIPERILNSEESINLVFAGQYNAGKSSILRVLTGRKDIAVGGGITTEETQSYDWNGIKVINTPGVHTQLRPDHDEITYRAISEADLLVFVVTNELFDSHIAEHFRNLAIEKNKVHEMVLVINKMQRCAKGNTTESQNVIREDIRKVLRPYSPEYLRISFIDAEAALASKSEDDPKISKILWKKSGIDSFTENLNDIVEKKGLTSKYSTALYTMEELLQDALACEETDDRDVDSLEELFLQERRTLIDARRHIPRVVEGDIQKSCSEVRREGQKISDMISGSANQEFVNQNFQKSQDRVQSITDQLDQTVQVKFDKQMDDLKGRIERITKSELAKELFPRLEHRVRDVPVSPNAMSNLKKVSDASSKLGAFLVRNSFKSNSGSIGGLLKLKNYSGTETHNAIKAVGKVFGKTFKPWEAIKWTRNVGIVGRGIGIIGHIISIAAQIKEDVDADKLESDLRESRAAIRAGFNDAAHEIEMHYDQITKTYVSSTLSPEIENVDKKLAELRNIQDEKSNFFKRISALLEETQIIIGELHSAENQLISPSGPYKTSPSGAGKF